MTKEMKGAKTAGEIQQVCVRLCMIKRLHRKSLTVHPERVHVGTGRLHDSECVCVRVCVYVCEHVSISGPAAADK